ncbi:unnamed protein product [Mytilus coruscus]|uniref:NCAM n=1 Tax=Mytilus coruscus TaxID=42192 RepID=A0A6J8A0I4_MYTCO|nr:unnamed protein product [Mytilus coruscus]
MYKADAGLGQRLLWRKGTTILSENTILGNTNVKDRSKITGDHSIGDYHLNISDIRQSDQTRYECSISKTTRVHSQQLIVIVGPSAITIENVTPDNKIPGIEGQDMTIKCTAVGGQPASDVKLVILGSTYIGKQSAQHTFKPVRANDGSDVTCRAGYEDIRYYPLNTTAYIYLKLKPVITPFSIETLSTEESKSFDVSCQSTGSRPAASVYWVLGQQRIYVTINSTTKSNHESLTNKYTMTSNIIYRVDRRYNGQKLICGAVNVAGYMESSLTLNVKYAPGVTVENKTLSLTDSSRQIHSTLDSNPQVNTCKWHHRSKYDEYIREFSDNNQILTLPTVSDDIRYKDTGVYVCTAENGIVGINGQLKQTGSGYVIVNAPPVITFDNRDNYTQYGKFGKSTELNVNVYSIPKYSRISWYINNTQLVHVSNKYAIKEVPAIVKDMFHDVDVLLDGYRVTLTILDLQEIDFINYTLRLYYSSQYVEHDVTVESASAPENPSYFFITSSSETRITVQWIPGYDGGHTQMFYIEYRISGTNAWFPQKIKTNNQLDSHNLYTLSKLQDKTTYELRMYAKNKFNQSQHTDIQKTKTLQSGIDEI